MGRSSGSLTGGRDGGRAGRSVHLHQKCATGQCGGPGRESSKVMHVVKALRPVAYYMKQQSHMTLEDSQRLRFGFVADELQQTLPSVVRESTSGALSVMYLDIIAVLAAAMKEQQAEIESIQHQVPELTRHFGDHVTENEKPM